jgi:hypothetical protein
VGQIGAATCVAFFNFTVPAGRIAVLRAFDYSFSPLFNLAFASEFTAGNFTGSIHVGAPTVITAGVIEQRGAVQLGYDNLLMGQRSSELQPTYIVADSGETISLIIRNLAALAYTGFRARFYGNLLLKTGRPTQFEPGTDPSTLRGILR